LPSKQVDDVQLQWKGLPDGLDADVLAAVAPYRRVWAVV
jgi:hypothetical protein